MISFRVILSGILTFYFLLQLEKEYEFGTLVGGKLIFSGFLDHIKTAEGTGRFDIFNCEKESILDGSKNMK